MLPDWHAFGITVNVVAREQPAYLFAMPCGGYDRVCRLFAVGLEGILVCAADQDQDPAKIIVCLAGQWSSRILQTGFGLRVYYARLWQGYAACRFFAIGSDEMSFRVVDQDQDSAEDYLTHSRYVWSIRILKSRLCI